MTNKINSIDVSEYFTNHYDNSGKLYAVEYKGNPLELQNAIRHLEQQIEAYKLSENEAKEIIAELEHKNKCLHKKNEKLKKKKDEYFVMNLNYEIKISDLIQALEEIREIRNILDENS